jgi:hypothetical protein
LKPKDENVSIANIDDWLIFAMLTNLQPDEKSDNG